MMAGFKPVALPMMLGVSKTSSITWTMAKTARTETATQKKFWSYSAALMAASNIPGKIATVCRYGTIFIAPAVNPKIIPMGRLMMLKPMANRMPTMKAIRA